MDLQNFFSAGFQIDNDFDKPSSTESTSNHSNPKCELSDIPDLVLTKLFKLLDHKDRMTAMSVCHRWDNVINETVGVTCYVGKHPVFNFPNLLDKITWVPLDALDHNLGFDRCIFGDISDSVNTDVNKLSTFWNPNLVDVVGFYGDISHHYFIKLTNPLKFMTSLTLHLTVFLSVDFGAHKMVKAYLKTLTIVYTHSLADISFTMNSAAENTVHKSLMAFMKNSYFDRVKSFAVRFPYFKAKMIELHYSIGIFCKRHSVSLTELSFHTPYEWSNTTFIPDESIKVSSLVETWNNVQFKKIVILPAPIILENADETIPVIQCKQKLNELWNCLLLEQTHLRRVQYENPDETWPFPSTMFMNNEATLTCAYLTINSKLLVDCTAMENCRCLVRLTLLAAYQIRVNNGHLDLDGFLPVDVDNKLPQFINAHKLPASLEDLEIYGVLISKKEIDGMFKIGLLPNIKYLSLLKISNRVENCGMTLNVLSTIIRETGVQSLSLKNSINIADAVRVFDKLKLRIKDDEVEMLERVLEYLDYERKQDLYYKNNPVLLSYEFSRFS